MDIKLTQGYVATVDNEDYDRVNQFKWQIKKCGNAIYACGWVGEWKNKKRMAMHRFIMNIPLNDIRKIDHADHDGLNNQKSNLRICTQFENMKNRISKNGSSKYKGVHWHKRDRKWYAQIRVNKKTIHLGIFAWEDQAALTYNKAAKKHHGEFALLNEVI